MIDNNHVQYDEKDMATENTLTYSEHHKLVEAALNEQNHRALALQMATSTVNADRVLETATQYLSFLSGENVLTEAELDKVKHDYFMTGYAKGQNEAIQGAAQGAQNGVRTAVELAKNDTMLRLRTALSAEFHRHDPEKRVTIRQAYDRAIEVTRSVENA